MAAETKVIGDVTYSATETDQNIVLTDDAFGIMDSIINLTRAVNRLADRIK